MAKRTPRSQANESTLGAPAEPKPKARSRSRAAVALEPSDTFAARPERIGELSQDTNYPPTDEDIRVRAYHRYLERGGGHGMDFEDWLEAERELKHKTD